MQMTGVFWEMKAEVQFSGWAKGAAAEPAPGHSRGQQASPGCAAGAAQGSLGTAVQG